MGNALILYMEDARRREDNARVHNSYCRWFRLPNWNSEGRGPAGDLNPKQEDGCMPFISKCVYGYSTAPAQHSTAQTLCVGDVETDQGRITDHSVPLRERVSSGFHGHD